jgi:hypothetical protein
MAKPKSALAQKRRVEGANMKGIIVLTVAVAMICAAGITLTIAQAEDKQTETVKQGGVVIKKETGPAGHATIGIVEDALDLEKIKEMPLTFKTLMNWDYDVSNNSPAPEIVQKLDGRKVRLTGFMYPLQEGKEIQYFCLLRSTQTCCYGPRPQYNQYVFVEMDKPTTFHRLDPVSCVGKFKVDPVPDEGFIYRMEGLTCESTAGGE